MAELTRRFRTLEMPQGKTPQQWVDDTIRGIFGRASLAIEPGQAGPAIQHDIVPTAYEPLGEAVFELQREPPVHRKVYYAPDSAQPDTETLRQLGLLARILRTPLELALERAAV